MAGEEELRAKAVLAEMQMRISQGPYAALSLAESASSDEVRATFLDLTKQFHPARFGRMSPEILRLANEVFLGIKSAHDQLMKLLGAPRHAPRGTPNSPGTQRASTAVPPGTQPGVHAALNPGTERGLNRGTDRTGINPGTERGLNRGTERPAIDPGSDRGIDRGTERSGIDRGLLPAPGPRTPPTGIPRLPGTAVARPATPRTGTPPPAESPQRQSHSSIEPPVRRGTPPGTPAPTRPTTPGGTPRLGTPPQQRQATPPSGPTPSGVRFGGGPSQPAGGAADEETMLKQAMNLLSSKDWSGARLAFHALAARVPQARNYRALLCYARGRETAATGRIDDAVMEFQRALQLDPELEIAKSAIREFQRKSRF